MRAEARSEDPSRDEGQLCLHVCITCRPADAPEGEIRPGLRLYQAISRALLEAGDAAPPVRIETVECLSVCKRPCTVAVSSPRRWTYIYGDLDPDASVAPLLDGLSRYAASADGLVPWRERPDIFRKGVVARVPPNCSLARERS
jgi:predicted metal-binding protein